MNRAPYLLQHVASAPSSLDIMMSDDDSTSRDSGVCLDMDENQPTCFSNYNFELEKFESMEIDDKDTTLTEENVENAENLENLLPLPSGSRTLRREKSACHVRLFGDNEAPDTPVAPRRSIVVALCIRPENQQDRPGGSVEEQSFRKRKMGFPSDDESYGQKLKKANKGGAYLHYHTEHLDYADDEDEILENLENKQPADGVDEEKRSGVNVDQIFDSFSNSQLPQPFVRPMAVAARHRKKKTMNDHRNASNKTTSMVLEKQSFDDDELDSIDKFHLNVKYSLYSINVTSSSCFRRITYDVLTMLLNTHSDEDFNRKFVLIDCRYPFEYEGGHIKHAINFFNPEQIGELFYHQNETPKHQKIPIFYCEYSQKRGPSMANALRDRDRNINMAMYPSVSFAEMYVLDQGYRHFYNRSRSDQLTHCVPDAYIEMAHKDFADDLKNYSFHKRGNAGQSVFRNATAPTTSGSTRHFIPTSSRSSTNIAAIVEESEERAVSPTETENQPNPSIASQTTPAPRAVNRQTSRRLLFKDDQQQSPTTFGKQLPQKDDEEEPPVMPPSKLVLSPPDNTPSTSPKSE